MVSHNVPGAAHTKLIAILHNLQHMAYLGDQRFIESDRQQIITKLLIFQLLWNVCNLIFNFQSCTLSFVKGLVIYIYIYRGDLLA